MDDAGKIINEYQEFYNGLEVDINGLRLSDTKQDQMPDEISVNIHRIWLAYYGQNAIQRIQENASILTRKISQIIGVESYSRFGLRTVYFRIEGDVNRFSANLYKQIASTQFVSLMGDGSDITEIRFTSKVKAGRFLTMISIGPLIIAHPPQKKSDFPENGATLDIDIGEEKSTGTIQLEPKHIPIFAEDATKYLRTKAENLLMFLKDGK